MTFVNAASDIKVVCVVEDSPRNDGNQDDHSNEGNHGNQSTLGIPALSLERREMHVGLHVKCMLLLSDFDQTWNVSTDFSKTLQYKIS
jgi:hypothetical protein